MTDDLDSGNMGGNGAEPNAPLSGSVSDQQNSSGQQGLEAALSQLTNRLDSIEKGFRTIQSDKDRGVASVKKEVGELKETLAQFEALKEKGFSTDEAVEQIELKRDIAELKKLLQPAASASSPGTGASGQGDVGRVIAELGLDVNDPQVSLLLSQGLNPLQLGIKAAQLAQQKANAPRPTGAQAPATPGSAQANSDVDSLTREYKQKMIAARGKPGELKAIQDDYKNKGVPIYEVDFSG